jgi:hypothetical protein
MPLSLGSYLLGVGTVVGALAFGFGGGVLLTHTAMKQSPSAGHTRVERARAEPEAGTPQASVAQVPAAQVTPTPDQAHPTSVAAIKPDTTVAEQTAADPAAPVSAAQGGTPKPDAARKPDSETPKQTQAAREPPPKQAAREQPPKQAEQTERAEAKSAESREPEHRAERSSERSRRYAERRQPDIAARVKQRRLVVQEEPAEQPAVEQVVVPRPPEQQHFDLFGGFFGRPADDADD